MRGALRIAAWPLVFACGTSAGDGGGGPGPADADAPIDASPTPDAGAPDGPAAAPRWRAVSTGYSVVGAAFDATSVYLSLVGNAGPGRLERRSKKDGALDPAFGTGGVVAIEGGSIAVGAEGVYVVPRSTYQMTKLDLAGAEKWKANVSGGVGAIGPAGVFTMSASQGGSGVYYWVIELRAHADGAKIAAFPTTSDFPCSINYSVPRAAVVDGGDLFVTGVGGDNGSSTFRWHTLKRAAADGAFGWGIGSTGSAGIGITVDADATYAFAEEGAGWRIEKRARATGDLVASFGAAGFADSMPPALRLYATALARDTTTLFAAGSAETQLADSGTSLVGRIERRETSTGALVATFGQDGVLTLADRPSFVSADDDSLYVVANASDGAVVERRDKATGAP